jgi:hypothetical protein
MLNHDDEGKLIILSDEEVLEKKRLREQKKREKLEKENEVEKLKDQIEFLKLQIRAEEMQVEMKEKERAEWQEKYEDCLKRNIDLYNKTQNLDKYDDVVNNNLLLQSKYDQLVDYVKILEEEGSPPIENTKPVLIRKPKS